MATSSSEALATRRATYQDVLDAPAHMVAEIINGALHTHPRPATRHVLASSVLGRRIGAPYQDETGGPGGWWILDEPELHLGEDILVPYFELTPYWVCEILSPSTRRVDLQEKRPIYAREGVPHLWLFDPADRTLEAFELRNGEWVLIATAKDDEPVSVRPFDAISFSLGDLWA